jgi:transcriptional regulator with XRE-family HTH domain
VGTEEFRREVASRLKSARRERTLTQRQLADLGHSTQQNISRYEKGFIPESWFLLARLHAEKGIDLNWLLAAPRTGDGANPGARDGSDPSRERAGTDSPGSSAPALSAPSGDGSLSPGSEPARSGELKPEVELSGPGADGGAKADEPRRPHGAGARPAGEPAAGDSVAAEASR